MRAALEGYDYSALLKKSKMIDALTPVELKGAALALEVAHMPFVELDKQVRNFAATIPTGSPYSDCARKLFDGLLHEFDTRREWLKTGDRSA